MAEQEKHEESKDAQATPPEVDERPAAATAPTSPATPPDEDEEKDPLPDDEENEEPDEPWTTDPNGAEFRNIRWRQVIDELMSGKTITEAYGLAYDIDIRKSDRLYQQAAANGSRLMRNDKFKRLWDRVNAERGFNDQMADWQLADLIMNPGVEPAVRRAAIADFNKLRGRVIDKVDHTSKGKRIEAPAIISTIKPRDAATTQAEATDGN